jgi:hypothetical protein
VSFEALAILGALALVTGAVSCLAYYLRRFQQPRPSAVRYFASAVVAAVVAHVAGAFSGIAVMCSSADAGNLCGIWGALGTGPLLAGLVLWTFGPVYRRAGARP